MKIFSYRSTIKLVISMSVVFAFCFNKVAADELEEPKEFEIDIDELLQDKQYDSYLFNGFFRTEIAYSFLDSDSDYAFSRNESGISKIQNTLNLSYERKVFEEWKIKASANLFHDAYYALEGKGNFPEETLDAYEKEAELRDTYIEGPITDNVWLKFGKQINAWGEADFSQVLSIGNPVDIRELGRTNIVDALVPVTATKLVFNHEGWLFDAVAIHEIRGNKIATEGSELDTYISLRNPNVIIEDTDEVEDNFENTEQLYRLFKSFSKGDFSVMYADVFTKQPHLEFGGYLPESETLIFKPEYKKIQAFGVAGNYIAGPWLLKTEIAKKHGLPIARLDVNQQLSSGNSDIYGISEQDAVEGVLGFTYAGLNSFTVSMESFFRVLDDYQPYLAMEERSWTHTLMVTKDFMGDRLSTQVLVTHVPVDSGSGQIVRAESSYDYTDALTFSFGLILYQSTDEGAPFYPYRRNDNVFTSFRYNF